MKKILVLCTGNSCRSQIAEGYLRKFAGPKAQVFSAGVEKHGVNPRAIQTMKEDCVDISDQTSNLLDEYLYLNFDFVITVCDNALERCPVFPGNAIRLHQNFPDPAKETGNETEVLEKFRKVRELIKTYCAGFVATHL